MYRLDLSSGAIERKLELPGIPYGNPTPIQNAAKRAWDRSGKRYGDPATSKSALGFEAQVELREGLQCTIAWTRQNLALVEACIERHRPNLSAKAA